MHVAEAEPHLPPDATLSERIERSNRGYLRGYEQNARMMGVLEQVATFNTRLAAIRRANRRYYVQRNTASIRRWQEQGLVDERIDPGYAASALGSMVDRSAYVWLVLGEPYELEEATIQLTRLYCNALGLPYHRDARADADPTTTDPGGSTDASPAARPTGSTTPSCATSPSRIPGPGEVVVRIGGAGVCHSDLHLLYEFPPGLMPYDPPFTLGHENAGWVHALGAGVTGLEVGQPVAVYGAWGCGHCIRCRQGMENYCVNAATAGASGGLGRDGGMAPYLLVPSARLVVPLGDLDPVAAAPLTDAGLTPYHAIRRSLPKLVPGSTAVAIGVGGLGHMGVQLLSAMTARTRDRRRPAPRGPRAGRRPRRRRHRRRPDRTPRPRSATRPAASAPTSCSTSSAPRRRCSSAPRSPARSATSPSSASPAAACPFGFFSVPYEVSLQTTYWGSITELMELLDLARRGIVQAEYTTYSLADAPQAYAALRAGTLRGRAVVVP